MVRLTALVKGLHDVSRAEGKQYEHRGTSLQAGYGEYPGRRRFCSGYPAVQRNAASGIRICYSHIEVLKAYVNDPPHIWVSFPIQPRSHFESGNFWESVLRLNEHQH